MAINKFTLGYHSLISLAFLFVQAKLSCKINNKYNAEYHFAMEAPIPPCPSFWRTNTDGSLIEYVCYLISKQVNEKLREDFTDILLIVAQ